MIEHVNGFTHPTEVVKLWKYLDFTKFVDILIDNSLYFCRSDMYDDKFEGSIPKVTKYQREQALKILNFTSKSNEFWDEETFIEAYEGFKKSIYIDCWHKNKFESAAMWNLYLKSDEGIAIQTTFNKYKKTLELSDLKFYLSDVNYIDFESEEPMSTEILNWSNLPYLYTLKRNSFSHENELRGFINKKIQSLNKIPGNPPGIKVNIDLNYLIENIYISPSSPEWIRNVVDKTIKRLGFNFNVIQSDINKTPIY